MEELTGREEGRSRETMRSRERPIVPFFRTSMRMESEEEAEEEVSEGRESWQEYL